MAFRQAEVVYRFPPTLPLRNRAFGIQGIQNDWRRCHAVQINHLEDRGLQFKKSFKRRQGQPLIFFNQHLAFRRAPDFRQHRSPEQFFRLHRDFFDAGGPNFCQQRFGEPHPLSNNRILPLSSNTSTDDRNPACRSGSNLRISMPSDIRISSMG